MIHGSYSRFAQAKWKLQTGGKPISQRKNLFVISASATENLNKRCAPYRDPSVIVQCPGRTIAPQEISIGGLGQLGSDGRLYVALPDGDERDVTPQVSGMDFYTFDIAAQRHTLSVSANGVDLMNAKPELCIGQQVTLLASWDPGLPAGTQDGYRWVASLDYINKIVPGVGEASEHYAFDPTLLTTNPATLWFYKEGSKHIW